MGSGDFGAVRFRSDSRMLIACDPAARVLSLYDVDSAQLITRLPVALRPDNLCFKPDGGQLFITGEGMDAVVIVSPYETEVAETVLAGRAPGAMAASNSYLIVASPQSGDVSIMDILSRKVIAVVSVGSDPGFVTITPGDQTPTSGGSAPARQDRRGSYHRCRRPGSRRSSGIHPSVRA